MNYKNIFTISLVLLLGWEAWSQGKVPMNHYTGTAYVNVPIGAVRDKDLSAGVSLSYAATGVKIEQQAGIVGLGWNLAAGGSISREVRGLPDDLNEVATLEDTRKGWLENGNHTDADNFSNTTNQTEGACEGEITTWSNLSTLYNQYKDDTEPDIFHFNFSGYSGKFVFDNTGTIRTIPYHDFRIDYVRGNQDRITSFTITTEDGTIYKFNTYEYINVRSFVQHPIGNVTGKPVQYFHRDFISYEPFVVQYHTAWHLSEVLSPTTDAKITFEYITRTVTYDDPVEMMVATNDADYEPVKQLIYFKRYNHDKKNLTKIKTTFDSEIEFVYSVANSDEYRRQLDVVKVYNGASGTKRLIRQFDLTYESLGIGLKDGICYERKYLKSVQEKSGVNTLPPYAFEYYGVDWGNNITLLPLKVDDGAVDFWGYYNGVTQDLEGPSLYVYPSEAPIKRYRTYPLSAYTGSQYILKGADRKPRDKTAAAGTLNRVTWPTGGQTLLFYETHQYRDTDENADQYGGGIRLSMQVQYDGVSHDNDITWQYEYKLTNGNSSGHLVYPAVFAVPSNVYEDFNTNILSYANILGPWSEANYNKMVARSIYNLAGNERSFGSTVVYAQIKEKLDGSGEKIYEYRTPALSNSITEDNDAWQASLTSLALNKAPGIVIDGKPLCNSRGFYVKGAYNYPYAANPFYDYKRGLLAKITEYRETGDRVRTTEYQYGTVDDVLATIRGVRYEVDHYESNGTPALFFQFSDYTLRAQENTVLQQVKETVYNDVSQSRTLVRTTDYEYGGRNHAYLTKASSTNADGKKYATHYVYPEDLELIGPKIGTGILAVNNLMGNHRHNVPLEVRSTVDGNTTSAALSIFKTHNGVARVDSVLEFRAENPDASFTTLTTEMASGLRRLKYHGSYTGVSKVVGNNVSGLTSSVNSLIKRRSTATIFGYGGQLPVLNIVNAEASQVLYASFDNDFERKLVPDNTSGLTTNAYSGDQAINFTSGGTTQLRGTVNKKDESYFLTFYAKASANETVTVDFNLAQVGSITVSNTNGSWKFYRIPINPSSWTFGNTFGVTIHGSDGLTVDQVTFYPADARVSSTSYSPGLGITSQTDAQGNTVFHEYDLHGRLKRTRDLDSNIIQQHTYGTMVNQN